MNKRKNLFFALFFCLAAVSCGVGIGVEKGLQFSGNSFKIALFADLHYGENAWDDWGPKQDVESDRVQSIVLDDERPDFVIYLGDLITANNLPTPNASMYWDQAISPTRVRGIPWATLFGNHDDASFVWPLEWFSTSGIPGVHCPPNTSFAGEKDCSFSGTTRIKLMKMEILKNPLSHSQIGPTELWPGVSNYILQISSSKDPKSASVFLYFLDSGGGSYPEVISYAQIKWFQEQSQAINPDSWVPELIFWHIPSQVFKNVAPSPKSSIKCPCVGSINLEEIDSQEAEWGIMDALLNRSSVKENHNDGLAKYFGRDKTLSLVTEHFYWLWMTRDVDRRVRQCKAVFVGHNHGLDWCCPYKHLWLCFARHSGYGGYGSWPRGSRIIEMNENPFSLNSWISMEDGDKHSHVELSS